MKYLVKKEYGDILEKSKEYGDFVRGSEDIDFF